MKYTYGKKDKLKSKKSIEELFICGETITSYPLRLVFLEGEKNKFLVNRRIFKGGITEAAFPQSYSHTTSPFGFRNNFNV